MDLHQQQQFGFLLQTAAERYALRLEERFRGATDALAQLRADPEHEAIMLTGFTDAIFEDFLLGNAAGAAFVLQGAPRREAPAVEGGRVEEVLVAMAKSVFADLLLLKTGEVLEQHSSFEGV